VCKANDVAEALGVPADYLGKIMHALVAARVLRSARGPSGGYRLAVKARDIPLTRVINPFQQLVPGDRCLMGDRLCNPMSPCSAHVRWASLRELLQNFIEETTVGDMIGASSHKSHTTWTEMTA
jgi:Rrf2 family protein